MNLNTLFLSKSSKVFCCLQSRTLHTTFYCLKKKSGVNDNNRFERTLLKLLKKNSFLPEEVSPFNSVNTPIEKKFRNAGKKQLHKRIIVREKMLSEVLLRQLQETIDSGQIEGLDDFHITFKSVSMNGKKSCFVAWKTHGLAADLHIKQALERQSAYIRHVIIHSHVLGIIPKFHFCIDSSVVNEEEVYRALNSGDLDMGPPDEISAIPEDVPAEENPIKGLEFPSTNPTFELFQVDNEALKDKIYAQIAKAKNDDSVSNTTDEISKHESSNEDHLHNVGLFER